MNTIADNKMVNRDADLQKIQSLENYFSTKINAQYSIMIGGFISVVILIATIYYEGVFANVNTTDLLARLVGTLGFDAAILIVFLYVALKMLPDIQRRQNLFIEYSSQLYSLVDSGQALPSLIDMKRNVDELKIDKKDDTTTAQPLIEAKTTKNNADRVFDTCLLLVTVLAAAILAYVSFLFSTNAANNLGQINFFFRVTTIVTIILIVGWIIVSISPSLPSPKLPKWVSFRRWFKQFFWNLFGNLFVFEIMAFVFFTIDNNLSSSFLTVNWGNFLAVFFTFPAIWYYWSMDNPHVRGKRMLIPVVEHIITYIVALLLLAYIIAYANSIPLPNFNP